LKGLIVHELIPGCLRTISAQRLSMAAVIRPTVAFCQTDRRVVAAWRNAPDRKAAWEIGRKYAKFNAAAVPGVEGP